jgi:putative ABC transport system permease protein
MFRTYLKTAVSNLLTHRLFAVINILGLTLAMTSAILLLLYVRYELSYDLHHERVDEIFRVVRETDTGAGESSFSQGTSGALGAALEQELLDVGQTVRLFQHWVLVYRPDDENRRFNQHLCLADPEILDVFSFPFVTGDPATALVPPDAAVLTESMAQKYFGSEDPIGRTLIIDNELIKGDFTITGVLEDPPTTSSIRFDMLIATPPAQFCRPQWEDWLPGPWRMTSTWFTLPAGFDHKPLEGRLAGLMARHMGVDVGDRERYHIQPLSRIHLFANSDYGLGAGGDLGATGDVRYVYLFATIATFIIAIGCINYMNLATARGTLRAREVGVRKAVGAGRGDLILQFYTESILLASVAFLLSLAVTALVLPVYSQLSGQDLDLTHVTAALPALLGLTLLSGLLSGSYPALLLSAFRPVEALKGAWQGHLSGARVRNLLVLFQVAVSVALVTGTFVVFQQLEFMHHRKLGFEPEHLVTLGLFMANPALRESDTEALKQEFLLHPGVLGASAVFGWPNGLPDTRIYPVHAEEVEGSMQMHYLGGDRDLLSTYRMELVAGRIPDDGLGDNFLVNETAVTLLGWKDPIGRAMDIDTEDQPGIRSGVIVGVVRDFHFQSLHEQIKPLLVGRPPILSSLMVRIDGSRVPETLSFLEAKWKQMVPVQDFGYRFQDQALARLYRSEERVGHIAILFATFAIVIAGLGLFGLASFAAERRRGEIGIRKALGDSALDILVRQGQELGKLVALGTLLGWPLAHLGMTDWLHNFAYRIDLGPGLFLVSGALAAVLTVIATGHQALKASRANPAQILRAE